mgnify:CR=1 FL=1
MRSPRTCPGTSNTLRGHAGIWWCTWVGVAQGAVQPLDTHVHSPLSCHFQPVEMARVQLMADEDPDCLPLLDRGDLLPALLSVWQRSRMHLLGVRAFTENMLNLPLDGSGDERGSEECRRYWQDLQMPRWREQAIADVRAEWQAGRLPLDYETYLKLLEGFPRRGSLDELVDGMDDEGETVEQAGGPSAC